MDKLSKEEINHIIKVLTQHDTISDFFKLDIKWRNDLASLNMSIVKKLEIMYMEEE